MHGVVRVVGSGEGGRVAPMSSCCARRAGSDMSALGGGCGRRRTRRGCGYFGLSARCFQPCPGRGPDRAVPPPARAALLAPRAGCAGCSRAARSCPDTLWRFPPFSCSCNSRAGRETLRAKGEVFRRKLLENRLHNGNRVAVSTLLLLSASVTGEVMTRFRRCRSISNLISVNKTLLQCFVF